jgi:hypothetical protein
MAQTLWQITRQVGCEHILTMLSGLDPNPLLNRVLNSLNPDGSLTGPGRPGRSRIAFILTHPDLSEIITDSDAVVGFAVDSGIAYQSPPIDLAAATDANYLRNTPIDLSTINPIMHVTPLSPSSIPIEGGPFAFPASQAEPYFVYNQGPIATPRSPFAISRADALLAGLASNPNGAMSFFVGISNNVFVGSIPQSGTAGSFQIEIDFSHSVAS